MPEPRGIALPALPFACRECQVLTISPSDGLPLSTTIRSAQEDVIGDDLMQHSSLCMGTLYSDVARHISA